LRGREFLHAGNLEEKVAELSLAWQPDLIVLDGRKAFVTNGPRTAPWWNPDCCWPRPTKWPSTTVRGDSGDCHFEIVT
ncbi:MAG: hypothetical protein M1401_15110, partial [Chloroflexi bacterium]|nr:hypothetical protein [Chloroflexota bacterium]